MRTRLRVILTAVAAAALALPTAASRGAGNQPTAGWTAEAAEAPKLFNLYQRAVAVDAQGRPHVAYGQDHLYYAFKDSGGWHVETADAAPGVGTDASLAVDAAGDAHVGCIDVVNGRVLYATNASGPWTTTTIDSNPAAANAFQFTSLALDGAGKVHVAYYDAARASLKYATNASGAWDVRTVDDDGTEGQYCSLAVDAAGRAFISYQSGGRAGGGVTKTHLRYATNASGRWKIEVADPDTSDPQGGLGVYTSIALDKQGKAHVGYVDHGGGSVLRHATNSSGSWKSEVVDDRQSLVANTSLGVDGAGVVHVGYYALNPSQSGIRHASAASGGWTTETVDPGAVATAIAVPTTGPIHFVDVDTSFRFGDSLLRHVAGTVGAWTKETVDASRIPGLGASLVVDGSGTAYVAHQCENEIHFTTNATGGWTTRIIDAGDASHGIAYQRTSLALDSQGRAHVAYVSTVAGGFGEVRHAVDASGTWTVEVVEGGAGAAAAIALDASDVPRSAYHKAASHAVRYAAKTGGVWTPQTVASTVGFVDAVSLALDGDVVHVAWYDAGPPQKLVYATNGSGGWASTVVDHDLGASGGNASLALDGAGKAHVAYLDASVGNVKHATNASGQWSSEFVTADGGASFPSLAVDASGGAHVGFRVGAGADGKLVYATNRSGQWKTSVVDAGPGLGRRFASEVVAVPESAASVVVTVVPVGFADVGAYGAVALDASGGVHFAYQDSTLGDLKYARPQDGSGTVVATIDYRASAGSAASPDDFGATQGSFGWSAGDTSPKSFVVPIENDALVEGDETVVLELSNPTGGLVVGTARAQLVIQDDDVPAGASVASILPKSVKLSLNAKDKSKSRLVASGFLDAGVGAVDFSAPATLAVGGFSFSIPRLEPQKDGSYRYVGHGADFTIAPQKTGSSRATFKLVVTGDPTGKIDPLSTLTLRFADGLIDATGVVGLQNGKYALGRIRGTLSAPDLFFYAAKATLAGGGKDTLTVKAGLVSDGAPPLAAPDVTVSFGPKYAVTIPLGKLVKKGDKFTFKDKGPGVTSLVLDYFHETLALNAKGIDLGDLPQGPQPVLVTVGAGKPHAMLVRMVHTGKALTY